MRSTASHELGQVLATITIGRPDLLADRWLRYLPSNPTLILPPPPAGEFVARVAATLDISRGSRLPRFRPASGFSAALSLSSRWAAIPTAPGSERFAEAVLPGSLIGSQVVVVCPLGGGFAHSPCGMLASLAHPRQRIALRAARDPAAAAELAGAVDGAAFFLAGSWGDSDIVASTSTLLAAQLLWRALQPVGKPDEQSGAWEESEVQRLTRLDLSPRVPEELAIDIVDAGDSRLSASRSLARVLRERLGPVAVTTPRD